MGLPDSMRFKPRSVKVEARYGHTAGGPTSCLSCAWWSGKCRWAKVPAVVRWRRGRVSDSDGAVWHFGSWDDTPDKLCPKRTTT